jgi:Zn-dependent peptidase ImmA (M78 family)/transcriptional regulator with XRE-family HTH domain
VAIGTFDGSRLRDARLAREMTASLLAERIGVSPGAISQYELRNTEPRPPVLARLATVLELPQAYFLRAPLPRDPAPHWYRSRSAATKRARESAEARQGWLRELVAFIDAQVELPKADIPDAELGSNPAAITDDAIEGAASDVRTHLKLGDGPVPNLVALLESAGCVVSAFAFGAAELSAFSQAASDRPYVLLNSEEDTCVRRRFSTAHELGHLVLHRRVSAAEAARPEIHKLMEHQAHRFASAFLFPQGAFAEEVYSLSLDALTHVKSRWKVAIQVLLRRAKDLDLVSQDKYERAFRDLSRRGFRMREPLDDTLVPETPRILNRAVDVLFSERVMTREELLYQVPFSHADIEALSGLPRGYLDGNSWGELVELKVRVGVSDATTSESAGSGAQVIRLRPRSN